MKPTCCRRIGRTFSLIAFAASCDFPGLLLTSTTRVNMGNSPFVGYGLKGTSREMRGAGCHPISGQNPTLLPSNEHRQGPEKVQPQDLGGQSDRRKSLGGRRVADSENFV